MRSFILNLIFSAMILPISAKPSRAYDMDCAIMLCMAGGFPPGAVCSAAYAEMIRRITPWPIRPPFGICSFAAAPVELGGSGGKWEVDVSTSDYAWLRRTRVLWFYGTSYKEDTGPRKWDWSLRSCDHENSNCQVLIRVYKSRTAWPISFVSQNGQTIPYPEDGRLPSLYRRAVLVEYGDYKGMMGHSAWYTY
ncbi:hypothetical protein [uncultured Aliiroseovarius sp.]|uniref:hypothetical protein n=1 Tax=uncultured Aliiroseovarius sp. TaxID=1658783 RepID=UPI002609C5DE|nr:hypothetical protein [uncultured Aliiroseovarius sp.]